MDRQTIGAKGWVLCKNCGNYHQIIPAIDAPVYWCNDELLKLKAGETVYIEELTNNTVRR